MPLCREAGCGVEIRFVRMNNGKMIPVEEGDPEAFYFFPDKPGHPQVVIVTEVGTVLRGLKASRTDNGVTRVMGWESHFSACPGHQGVGGKR